MLGGEEGAEPGLPGLGSPEYRTSGVCPLDEAALDLRGCLANIREAQRGLPIPDRIRYGARRLGLLQLPVAGSFHQFVQSIAKTPQNRRFFGGPVQVAPPGSAYPRLFRGECPTSTEAVLVWVSAKGHR